MASEAYLRWKGCSRKVRYSQCDYADEAAKRTPKKGRRRAKSYLCQFCDGWHVGHDFASRNKDSARMRKLRRHE